MSRARSRRINANYRAGLFVPSQQLAVIRELLGPSTTARSTCLVRHEILLVIDESVPAVHPLCEDRYTPAYSEHLVDRFLTALMARPTSGRVMCAATDLVPTPGPHQRVRGCGRSSELLSVGRSGSLVGRCLRGRRSTFRGIRTCRVLCVENSCGAREQVDRRVKPLVSRAAGRPACMRLRHWRRRCAGSPEHRDGGCRAGAQCAGTGSFRGACGSTSLVRTSVADKLCKDSVPPCVAVRAVLIVGG